MSASELKYFEILKRKISQTLCQTYQGIDPDIEHWKGKEISFFQTDLEAKANGRISEKWFYTHMKSDHKSLPRIDVLDMLSKYVGYIGWIDFKEHHRTKSAFISNKIKWYAIIIVLFIITLGFYMGFSSQKMYELCFVDAYTREVLVDKDIEVWLLSDDESPYRLNDVQDGCVRISTKNNILKMVVQAPYYHADTIIRTLRKKEMYEKIALKPDDFAMMIHVFSKSDLQDWNKRRQQLNEMFLENAKIFQVSSDGNTGIEMYNKNDFINKLTIPVGSLGKIDVLQIKYQRDKIAVLRFVQLNEENHD